MFGMYPSFENRIPAGHYIFSHSIMNIVVQEQPSPLESILRTLAHSISLLPNLHTVQIHFTITSPPLGESFFSPGLRAEI